ncbi:hypothetical protein ACFB49_35460 [Sphingomonas sp. DBB INV C78]|uniref:DUF3313 family protein n=1 Tax=Sphingomonas sp. DBB INV C78 TaxID=3349434 RepID=UPI0036D38869
MLRGIMTSIVGLSLVAAVVPATMAIAKAPDTWDSLYKVKSKRLDAVYLLPGADFRTYTKVMLDPTEVAFQKNWLRDYNNSTIGVSRRISDSDAEKMLGEVRAGFEEAFRQAQTASGYQVVTTPGPDVLRIRTAVINISVNAPDVMAPGRSRTYSREAGEATLVLEVRDSQSGAILGRAVDAREIGDTMAYMRNSVTNRSDYMMAFKRWAEISAKGLDELKALSPINTNAQPAK